ncbi:MAG: DUF3240 family protein [Piscirickettsiaceae bacterium]|nr:DUF3240 family protein [Piscirickettsiaceae bacterium]
MKNLTLIVHTSSQQDLADQLRNMTQISGFIFSSVEGHSRQAENDPFLSARDKVVGYIPRIRVDVLLEDSDVDSVINVLRTAREGIEHKDLYWITAVEQSGHL